MRYNPGGGTEALAAEAETVSETTETTSITITPENDSENPAKATITDTVTEGEVQDKILDEVNTGSTILNSDNTSAGTLQEDDTIIDENGNTVTESVITQTDDNTYVGTAQQTETNTETNETTTTTTTVTATVEEGTLEVTGTWEGTSSGEDDGKLENVDTLGPSDDLLENVQNNGVSDEDIEGYKEAYEEYTKAEAEMAEKYEVVETYRELKNKAQAEYNSYYAVYKEKGTDTNNAKRAWNNAKTNVTKAETNKSKEIISYIKANYSKYSNAGNSTIRKSEEYIALMAEYKNSAEYKKLTETVESTEAAYDKEYQALINYKDTTLNPAESKLNEAKSKYNEAATAYSQASKKAGAAITEMDNYKKGLILTPDSSKGYLYWIEAGSETETETETNQTLTLTGNSLKSAAIVGSNDVESYAGNAGMILELEDKDGNKYYAYCADRETTTSYVADYDIVNVYDSTEMTEETAAHVTYIVTNGYWGEKEGTGSLKSVQELAKTYDSTIDETLINDALALTVTQAAIWAYTNPDYIVSGSEEEGNAKTILDCAKSKDAQQLLLSYYLSANVADGAMGITNGDKYKMSDEEETAATALFWALYNEKLNTDAYEDTSTDIITKDDIKSVTISNLDKVDEDEMTVEALTKLVAASLDDKNEASASDSAKKLLDDTAAGSELYTGDVTLTVAVVKDRINSDNLKVYIFADDVLVAVKSFADITEMEDDGNGNTNFTVTNVVLPTGKNIRIELNGEQNIEGAYLYQSTVGTSQTLVGLIAGEAERTVDIDVTIKFDVEGNGSVIRTDKVTTTTTPSTPDGTTPETTITDEDTPLTDIPDDVTDIEAEDTPLAEGVEIADSDVPMADVPETGDGVNGWYLMTVFSALGLLWIAIDSKKRKAAESK